MKQVQEYGGSVEIDDDLCEGRLWSDLSTVQLLERCTKKETGNCHHKFILIMHNLLFL